MNKCFIPYIISIFLSLIYLTIAIPLYFHIYYGTDFSCQVKSCINTDFGSIVELSSDMMNETICSYNNCTNSSLLTCYYNSGHLLLERPYNITYINHSPQKHLNGKIQYNE